MLSSLMSSKNPQPSVSGCANQSVPPPHVAAYLPSLLQQPDALMGKICKIFKHGRNTVTSLMTASHGSSMKHVQFTALSQLSATCGCQ